MCAPRHIVSSPTPPHPSQLCRGASSAERKAYQLPREGLEAFRYISQSGCTTIEGVDDAAEFAGVKAALAAVGVDQTRQRALFSVLAAILWLGNVEFEAVSDDEGEWQQRNEGAAHLVGGGDGATQHCGAPPPRRVRALPRPPAH